MLQMQKTLNKDAVFEGIGVHSGLTARVVLKPAAENFGVVIVNPKFPNEVFKIGSIIPEVAIQATVLKQKSWMLSTVEHLLAAVFSIGLDNVLIEIEGFELPIIDGSALPFVQGILDAGLTSQNTCKKYLMPKRFLRFEDEKTGRYLEITPLKQCADGDFVHTLEIDYIADFNHNLIGVSNFKCILTQDFFVDEIAPARTFGFLEQLPQIRKHGLAKGTSLGNTLILSNEGFLNDPRFQDECIRHKVLDLIGDLGLLGLQIVGSIKACKTGHNFNREVVVHYLSYPDQWLII